MKSCWGCGFRAELDSGVSAGLVQRGRAANPGAQSPWGPGARGKPQPGGQSPTERPAAPDGVCWSSSSSISWGAAHRGHAASEGTSSSSSTSEVKTDKGVISFLLSSIKYFKLLVTLTISSEHAVVSGLYCYIYASRL